MTERVDQVLAVLPRGNLLDDEVWARRHRLLLVVLAVHVPALLLLGLLAGRSLAAASAALLPVVAGLAAGVWTRGRLPRSLAVTVGLVLGAEVLVNFAGDLPEAHFHYFVVIGFVALYQDWRPYLVALAFAVLGHGLLGAVLPGSLYGHDAGGSPWTWALLHGGFILAASAVQVVFWKQMERQQAAAHAYYSRLYEGERAVVAQLRQAQTVKDQLIGVVGHEFRTPLTAIQGFARTLDARFDRMDRDAAQTCTQAIEREAKRLTRMVANLLAASEDLQPGEYDRCVLGDVAAHAVKEVIEITPTAARHIQVHIPEDHVVAMTADAAGQLLANLLDNAVKFAAPDTDVGVSSRVEDEHVVVEVTNVGPGVSDADRDRIFDAFVQADSSDTRRYGGIGLGLHIVRKIAEAHGGSIGVHGEGPVVIFRARLPLGAEHPELPRVHRRLAPLPVVLPVAAEHRAGHAHAG